MAKTIRDLYLEGKRIYISIRPTMPTRRQPSPLSLQVPLELAEMLFRPAPSPCGGHPLVANKFKAKDAIRIIASYPGEVS